jgi:biotin transport system substrate-specific component
MAAADLKHVMATSTDLLWALVGLLLTIGGTFLEASMAVPSWAPLSPMLQTAPLGVTYQVGAVLLAGCLGGRTAGALSQVAYILLGLSWLPIFAQGGGMDYMRQPTFGYLLGFIPGAWVCGFLAFKALPRLESLAFSCLCGLVVIHLVGISYLVGHLSTGWLSTHQLPLLTVLLKYSVYPLPGQLAVLCATTVIAFVLRQALFY